MRAPLSVVIPTLDATGRLGPCVAALGEGLMTGLVRELVIADGGSSDAIAEIAEALGARLVTAPRGRGAQLAAGARAVEGEWLLFLHADTVLAPGWADAVRSHIAARPGKAGYFRLRFDHGAVMARLVAGWANLRSGLFGLPFGDQGLLVSRELHDAVGGYPEIPLMEDVAMARRLGRRRLVPLAGEAVTSAERYAAGGWIRRGARNLSTQALYFVGIAPERLLARYERDK